MREQTDGSTLFKSFGKLIEDGLVWLAKHNTASSLASKVIVDSELSERARNLIAYYISQQADFRGDSIFQRLEDAGVSESFISALFQQLIRMSFFKRVRDNTDEKYHKYLP